MATIGLNIGASTREPNAGIEFQLVQNLHDLYGRGFARVEIPNETVESIPGQFKTELCTTYAKRLATLPANILLHIGHTPKLDGPWADELGAQEGPVTGTKPSGMIPPRAWWPQLCLTEERKIQIVANELKAGQVLRGHIGNEYDELAWVSQELADWLRYLRSHLKSKFPGMRIGGPSIGSYHSQGTLAKQLSKTRSFLAQLKGSPVWSALAEFDFQTINCYRLFDRPVTPAQYWTELRIVIGDVERRLRPLGPVVLTEWGASDSQIGHGGNRHAVLSECLGRLKRMRIIEAACAYRSTGPEGFVEAGF